MLLLRWSITAMAIGATIAKGEGATMIAVGRNTMTKAVVDADIHCYYLSPFARGVDDDR
jgi:hypothetical protein